MHTQHLTRARTRAISLSRSPVPPPLSPAPPSLRIEDRLGILFTHTSTCGNAWRPAFILLLFLSVLPALSGSLTHIYYDILKQTNACGNAWRPAFILLLFLSHLPALCGSLTHIYYDILKQTNACGNAWRPAFILLLFLSLCRCRLIIPALCRSLTLIYYNIINFKILKL